MTTWALLLLVSVLLDTPGLSFSERYDRALSHQCEGDLSCQKLIKEEAQDDLLPKSERQRFTCGPCKKIIQKLKSLVGEKPNEDSIAQSATRVCSKMKLLKRPCSFIVRKSLSFISKNLIKGKDAHAVCEGLKFCRPHTSPL